MLRIDDDARVRVVTLDRPDALNAFDQALYRTTTGALRDAAAAPDVAVLVLTGTGRAFCAGTDMVEASAVARGERPPPAEHAFHGFLDAVATFSKPLLCAVNGLALGIGATVLGLADLVLMSSSARVRFPFTDLAVAPEAGSSYTLPRLLGHQHAVWALMSSEWLSADDCAAMGLVWKVTGPDALLDDTMAAARVLASKPIASLVECKRVITASRGEALAAAQAREGQAFRRLLDEPARTEALRALAERRAPDFATVDAEHPVDVARHASS